MKTAFFHDCVFIKNIDGNIYTTGGLDYKKLNEYVKYFGNVTVFSRCRNIKKDDDIEKMSKATTEGVEFNSIPNLNIFSLYYGNANKRLKKLIKNSDFIIIRLPSYIGLVAAKEARKQKKKYLIEMVACPWDALWNYGKIQKKLFALPTYILNKKIVKKASNVIYVSEKFLQSRYPTNGKNIACSDVVLDNIDEKVIENRKNKIENMDKNKKIKLLTLANIGLKCKGQQFVIKAISNLRKKGIEVEYYLARWRVFTIY